MRKIIAVFVAIFAVSTALLPLSAVLAENEEKESLFPKITGFLAKPFEEDVDMTSISIVMDPGSEIRISRDVHASSDANVTLLLQVVEKSRRTGKILDMHLEYVGQYNANQRNEIKFVMPQTVGSHRDYYFTCIITANPGVYYGENPRERTAMEVGTFEQIYEFCDEEFYAHEPVNDYYICQNGEVVWCGAYTERKAYALYGNNAYLSVEQAKAHCQP